MPDILHGFGVQAAPAKVFAALSTTEGLATWWTSDTRGQSKPGGVIEFRFGERGRIHTKVLELTPDGTVRWEVVDGPTDWVGTTIRFDLTEEDGATAILFKHENWPSQTEFMHHCSTKWATFLLSLKDRLEGGAGRAYPNDVHISNKGD